MCLATPFDIVHGSVEAKESTKRVPHRSLSKLPRGMSKLKMISKVVSKRQSKPIEEKDENSDDDMKDIQNSLVNQYSFRRKNSILGSRLPSSSFDAMSPVSKRVVGFKEFKENESRDRDTESNSNSVSISIDSPMAQVPLIQKPKVIPRKREIV